jgi:hypothetical protein
VREREREREKKKREKHREKRETKSKRRVRRKHNRVRAREIELRREYKKKHHSTSVQRGSGRCEERVVLLPEHLVKQRIADQRIKLLALCSCNTTRLSNNLKSEKTHTIIKLISDGDGNTKKKKKNKK